MKYCRFLLDNQPFYGAVEDRGGELWIADLTAAPDEDHAFRRIHARSNSISFSFEPMPLSAAQLLPPVTPPRSSASAATTATTPRNLAMKFPPSRCSSSSRPPLCSPPAAQSACPPSPRALISKANWRWSSAAASPSSPRRRLALSHPRLHPGQRRHRPRSAKKRRPVDARQGF